MYYPLIADSAALKPLSGKGGAAFIDWVAAMLVRTRLHVQLSYAIAQKEPSLSTVGWMLTPNTMANVARSHWYSEYQDLLSRSKVRWQVKTYSPKESIVLTDHPVCEARIRDLDTTVAIVPVSKRRVLFGGLEEAVRRLNVSADRLNAYMAAWAERVVFAADTETLQHLITNLRNWCDEACRPFFGLFDRLPNQQVPANVDMTAWWDQTKDTCGDSILPWMKRGE